MKKTKIFLLIMISAIVLLLALSFFNSFKTVQPIGGLVVDKLTGVPLEGIEVTRVIFVNEGFRFGKMFRIECYSNCYNDIIENEFSTKTYKNGRFDFSSIKIFQLPFLDKIEKIEGLYVNINGTKGETKLLNSEYSGALSYPETKVMTNAPIKYALSLPTRSISTERNSVSKIENYFPSKNIKINLYPIVESLEDCKGDSFCINFNQYNFLCNKNLFDVCENNKYENDADVVRDHCYFLSAILSKSPKYCNKISNENYLNRCIWTFELPETSDSKSEISNAMFYVPDIFKNSCKEAVDKAKKDIDKKIFYRHGINSYYFNLTFPRTWKNNVRREKTIDKCLYSFDRCLYSLGFGFPPQEPLFYINVHDKIQWEKMDKKNGEFVYLGENSKYIFSYTLIRNSSTDDVTKARMLEIEGILRTFESTETY